MKRFLMLVGVAVVAAAMYVAASPASQRSTGPTQKQFLALQKKVTALSKSLKTTKSEADAAVGFIASCLVSTKAGALGVSQFGDPNGTFGYRYDSDGTGPTADTFTSAIDADGSATPAAYLQAVDPTCIAPALRHRAAHAGSSPLLLHGERFH
jgi:hypothetical protein